MCQAPLSAISLYFRSQQRRTAATNTMTQRDSPPTLDSLSLGSHGLPAIGSSVWFEDDRIKTASKFLINAWKTVCDIRITIKPKFDRESPKLFNSREKGVLSPNAMEHLSQCTRQ